MTQRPDRALSIGGYIGITISIGIVLVVAISAGFLFVKRHRQRHKRKLDADGSQRDGEHDQSGFEQTELDAGQPIRMRNWQKPELDANATRAELETDGLPAELDGVPRAELEANPIKMRLAPLRDSWDTRPY